MCRHVSVLQSLLTPSDRLLGYAMPQGHGLQAKAEDLRTETACLYAAACKYVQLKYTKRLPILSTFQLQLRAGLSLRAGCLKVQHKNIGNAASHQFWNSNQMDWEEPIVQAHPASRYSSVSSVVALMC